MPAEGKPLLFIKQSVARARAESSVETIIAIGSMPEKAYPRAGPRSRSTTPFSESASS